MSDDVLVRVENVSKRFCRSLKRSLWYGLQDLGSEIGGRSLSGGDGLQQSSADVALRKDEFWAVKDVSFELRRGECIGLIGHNGAGKTTLLRMLNGLIKPDAGRIEMRGQVGALIALGAGFNPILTGRENISISASVLGLSQRQIESKIDEIIDFSGVGEFIDMPLKGYSSGMSVRLGFSVAAILIKPDILFLDEVLAVGDIGFTIKCLNVVRQLTKDACVIFVSHNMQFISSFCTRVAVLNRGQLKIDARNPADGTDYYFSLMEDCAQTSGTGDALLKTFELICKGTLVQEVEPVLLQGTSVQIKLEILVLRSESDVRVTVVIQDHSKSAIQVIPVLDLDGQKECFLPSGQTKLVLPIGQLDLNAGRYSFVVIVVDNANDKVLARVQGVSPFRIHAKQIYWGKIVRPVAPTLIEMTPSISDDLCSINDSQ